MALALRMNRNSVSTNGVQTAVHLRPTFGSTMLSRTNRTTASSAFMKPVGTSLSCRRYARTTGTTTARIRPATIQSIRTCLVTDRSTPKTTGKWMSGWSRPLLETCSMMTFPASNVSGCAAGA
jgi:SH3-like domain-containing protein